MSTSKFDGIRITTSNLASLNVSPSPTSKSKLPSIYTPGSGRTVTRDTSDHAIMKRDREFKKRFLLSSRGISHVKDALMKVKSEENLEELHQILGFPKDVWHMPTDIDSLRQMSLSPAPSVTHESQLSYRRSRLDSSPEVVSLGVPSGRRDAELLTTWLDGMQRQLLEKSTLNLEDLFEDARLVYTVCFKELVRQVSVHCIERGKLIEMVWKGYLGLLERALAINIQKQDEIHKDWEAKMSELVKEQKKTQTHMERVIASLNREKITLERGLKAKDQAISLHELREERLMERIQVIQKHYESLRKTLMELKEDNRILNVQLHNSRQIAFARQPSLKKFKRKTSKDFTSEIEKDPIMQNLGKITDEELQQVEKLNEEIIIFGELYAEQHEEELFLKEDFHNIGIDAPFIEIEDSETQTMIEYVAGGVYADSVEPKPIEVNKTSSSLNLKKLLEGSVLEAMETTENHLMSMTDFLKDIMAIKLKDEILKFEHLLLETLQEPENPQENLLEVKAQRTAALLNSLKNVKPMQNLRLMEVKSEQNQENILTSFYDSITKVLLGIPNKSQSTDNLESAREEDEEGEEGEEGGPLTEENEEDPNDTNEVKAPYKRRIGKTTSTLEFKLGRSRFAQKLVSIRAFQSSTSAQGLMQKVMNTPVPKLKNVMIKKMLLKTIGNLYDERISNTKDIDSSKQSELRTFVYDSLKQKYGLSKVAETKFTQLLSSCMKFKSIGRIYNFGRFMGLYDPFEKEDLELYLKTRDILQKLIGKDWHPIYHEEVIWIPLTAAIDTLQNSAYESFSQSSLDYLRGKLEEMKFYDAKAKSHNLQLENFLMLIVNFKRDLKQKAESFTRIVFDAADVRSR